ncbi:hypothetical protein [Streptomyces acidiscabies]|uniref:Uncharacterized protein n=1 Tax=Streptomyces acidiscabies TaxID=42234 RepID=A0AAP6EKI9_9ACTN|nr:hypothetical protein [Streptomyces acidiscabies]MBZ3916718.1 hypothetical protein [Streptomyces acidiscabies]MDX2965645.1 hypothetical protein [Streptomyces acidiscabies]MDX3024853.1 hypothetical protein [Streptomyces acidiscabies]MDX3795561.1 hypothetical protein [Streptomyces acidiscabies]
MRLPATLLTASACALTASDAAVPTAGATKLADTVFRRASEPPSLRLQLLVLSQVS